ncbi:hypothetical protein [Prauserella muralis]|uniref:hypothetical protein n=1 Tax=Prauserella muralis TaxID=588067 RepID=UPI0011ABE337|nr:hypothetical protein [Prauserella muralis]TWE27790.1 hypothetical protein FHX69_0437 [Prauserella muralis]
MCQRTTCSRCGKPTYRGCGQHVEQVLGDVPMSRRCSCAQDGKREPGTVRRLFRRR